MLSLSSGDFEQVCSDHYLIGPQLKTCECNTICNVCSSYHRLREQRKFFHSRFPSSPHQLHKELWLRLWIFHAESLLQHPHVTAETSDHPDYCWRYELLHAVPTWCQTEEELVHCCCHGWTGRNLHCGSCQPRRIYSSYRGCRSRNHRTNRTPLWSTCKCSWWWCGNNTVLMVVGVRQCSVCVCSSVVSTCRRCSSATPPSRAVENYNSGIQSTVTEEIAGAEDYI